jgi:hypothetical protein
VTIVRITDHSITADGHAGDREMCIAASTVVQLAAAIFERAGVIHECAIDRATSHFHVSFGHGPVTDAVRHGASELLEELAEDHPERFQVVF